MESFVNDLGGIFSWLIKTSIHASVIVCILILVKGLLSKRLTPRWHYYLWLLVIARMLMPAAPQSTLSIFNLIPAEKTQNSVSEPETIVAEVSEEPSAVSGAEANVTPQPLGGMEEPVITAKEYPVETAEVHETVTGEATGIETAAAGEVQVEESEPIDYFAVLTVVWLGGVAALGLYVIAGNFRLGRIVRIQRPVTDSRVLDLLEDCKSQMNLHAYLSVVETDKVSCPALFGFIRPRLLLPKGMIDKLSTGQLRHVFLHELAHLKRGDIYFGWLVAILQTLHWFNPLVWFAFHKMRADRELACDELALSTMKNEEPGEYGKTIVSLLEDFSTPAYNPGLAGILEDRSQLKRRITMIAKHKKGSYGFSILAAIVMVTICAVALTSAKDKTPVEEKKVLANEFVDLLLDGQFKKAAKNFDMTMKKTLGAKKLKMAWHQTTTDAGAFEKKLGTRAEKYLWSDIIYVTCKFEEGPLDVKVVYNKNKKISGLWFLPVPEKVLKGYAEEEAGSDLTDAVLSLNLQEGQVFRYRTTDDLKIEFAETDDLGISHKSRSTIDYRFEVIKSDPDGYLINIILEQFNPKSKAADSSFSIRPGGNFDNLPEGANPMMVYAYLTKHPATFRVSKKGQIVEMVSEESFIKGLNEFIIERNPEFKNATVEPKDWPNQTLSYIPLIAVCKFPEGSVSLNDTWEDKRGDLNITYKLSKFKGNKAFIEVEAATEKENTDVHFNYKTLSNIIEVNMKTGLVAAIKNEYVTVVEQGDVKTTCRVKNVVKPLEKEDKTTGSGAVNSASNGNLVGKLNADVGKVGTVTAEYGDALYGNDNLYTSRLYRGRVKKGAIIELMDTAVIKNKHNIPIIKVKTKAKSGTVGAGTIAWVNLKDTSFADDFVPGEETEDPGSFNSASIYTTGENTSAEAAYVIQKVHNRYANIKTFQAFGEMSVEIDKSQDKKAGIAEKIVNKIITKQPQRSFFSIKIAKPNLYCVQWNDNYNRRVTNKIGYSWSTGKGSYVLQFGKYNEYDSFSRGVITAERFTVQPSIFFYRSASSPFYLRQTRLAGNEMVDGVECYVLTGKRGNRTYTFWISVKDYLVLKYKQVSGGDIEEVIEEEIKSFGNNITPEKAANIRKKYLEIEKSAPKGIFTRIQTYRNIIIDEPISIENFKPSEDIEEIRSRLDKARLETTTAPGGIDSTEPLNSWRDDFESGGLENWELFSSSLKSATTSDAHSGDYSLELWANIENGKKTESAIVKSFGKTAETATVEAWIKPLVWSNAFSDIHFTFMTGGGRIDEGMGRFWMWGPSDGYYYDLSKKQKRFTHNLPLNTWTKVKIEYATANNGTVKYYENDKLQLTIPNCGTDVQGFFLKAGICSGPVRFLVDDVSYSVKLKVSDPSNSTRDLLIQRREILSNSLKRLENMYSRGMASQGQVDEAKIVLLEVESELAKTPEKRIDLLEQIVELYLKREKALESFIEAGRANPEDMKKTKLKRLETQAEIQKTKAPGASNSALLNESILNKIVGTWDVKTEKSKGSGNVRRLEIMPDGTVKRYELESAIYADKIISLDERHMTIQYGSGSSSKFGLSLDDGQMILSDNSMTVVLERATKKVPGTSNSAERLVISPPEKENLIKTAGIYDKMRCEDACEIFLNLSKSNQLDYAAKLIYYMSERTSANVLAAMSKKNPTIAAEITNKLAQIQVPGALKSADNRKELIRKTIKDFWKAVDAGDSKTVDWLIDPLLFHNYAKDQDLSILELLQTLKLKYKQQYGMEPANIEDILLSSHTESLAFTKFYGGSGDAGSNGIAFVYYLKKSGNGFKIRGIDDHYKSDNIGKLLPEFREQYDRFRYPERRKAEIAIRSLGSFLEMYYYVHNKWPQSIEEALTIEKYREGNGNFRLQQYGGKGSMVRGGPFKSDLKHYKDYVFLTDKERFKIKDRTVFAYDTNLYEKERYERLDTHRGVHVLYLKDDGSKKFDVEFVFLGILEQNGIDTGEFKLPGTARIQKVFPYIGRAIGDKATIRSDRTVPENVKIRSGAGLAYYTCGELEVGAEVTVVAEKFGWAQILPPKGSFSWIAKKYVKIDPSNSKRGIVTADDVRVWVGSPGYDALTSSTTQMKLSRKNSDVVELLSEEDSNYFKIVPPAGGYLYVEAKQLEYVGAVKKSNVHKKRYFVTIVADSEDKLVGYDGEQLGWDELREKVENLPDKKNTVLEVAYKPGVLPTFKDDADRGVWLFDNKVFRKAENFVKELGLDYLSYVGQDNPGSRRGPVSIRTENKLELNKDIAVGLGSFEEKPLLNIETARFNLSDDNLIAKLKYSVISYPHTFWEIGVRLLDDKGHQIKSVVKNYDNKGIAAGVAVRFKEEIAFDFGQVDIKTVDRFEVKLREIIKTQTEALKSPQWKELTLPDMDSGKNAAMLALDTHELVPLHDKSDEKWVKEMMQTPGRCYLLYEEASNKEGLMMVKGLSWLGVKTHETKQYKPIIKMISKRLPDTFTMTSHDGQSYEFTVLETSRTACKLKYRVIKKSESDKGQQGDKSESIKKVLLASNMFKVLDMRKGKIIDIPKALEDETQLRQYVEKNCGCAVIFDHDGEMSHLAFINAANISRPTEIKNGFKIMSFESNNVPQQIILTAKDQKKYRLKITNASDVGVSLEYQGLVEKAANTIKASTAKSKLEDYLGTWELIEAKGGTPEIKAMTIIFRPDGNLLLEYAYGKGRIFVRDETYIFKNNQVIIDDGEAVCFIEGEKLIVSSDDAKFALKKITSYDPESEKKILQNLLGKWEMIEVKGAGANQFKTMTLVFNSDKAVTIEFSDLKGNTETKEDSYVIKNNRIMIDDEAVGFIENGKLIITADDTKFTFKMKTTQKASDTITYIVEFKPVKPFSPQTASELLAAFNQDHPKGVRTHHYRTKAFNGQLLGYICVDSHAGKEAVEKMLTDSSKLELIRSGKATERSLERLYSLRQESLGESQTQLPKFAEIANDRYLDEGQKNYRDWTRRTFAGFVNLSAFSEKSADERSKLEAQWIDQIDKGRSGEYYLAINRLAAVKSKKAVAPLIKIAAERREKDNRDRWMATRALGIIGEKSAIPELIHLVYHYNQNTRFWAQISLVRLTGKNFGTDYKAWAKWWNENNDSPKVQSEKIEWTTRYKEYADPEKQKEQDGSFYSTTNTTNSQSIDEKSKALVEDFFKHNYRDITSRKTIEWGKASVDKEDNLSIRYKYEAVIWGKKTIVENKVWTFDKDGRFVSVVKVDESKPVEIILSPDKKAEALDGKLVFHGRYTHRSRNSDYSLPGEIWIKEGKDGSVNAVSDLPWMGTYDHAVSDSTGQFAAYSTQRYAAGSGEPYSIDMKLADGKIKLTRRGVREDVTDKEIAVAEGARFSPNTRPDSYTAANILFRSLKLASGKSKEMVVYDWDNTGEKLVDYKIQITNKGKESVTVPAGTFNANHYVLKQLTSANTWFKKRAGHITDFWVLDNNVIVRILRHREPYELVLLDYTTPKSLGEIDVAGEWENFFKKLEAAKSMDEFDKILRTTKISGRRENYLTVKGRIYDSSGKPVAGATLAGKTTPLEYGGVGETREETERVKGQVISGVSDKDGYYELKGFKAANYFHVFQMLINKNRDARGPWKFFVELTAGNDEMVLDAPVKIPLAGEDELYRARRLLKAYSSISDLNEKQKEEVKENKDQRYPFAKCSGSTLTGVDILLKKRPPQDISLSE